MDIKMSWIVILGCMVLVLLCWIDFRDKIIRPKSSVRYYLAFSFFMVVNLSIYFLLLKLVLSEDPALILSGGGNANYTGLQLFQPLVLSVMYFGAGAATYRFSDKVSVNLYQQIINMFQSFFQLPPKIRSWIDKCIKEASFEIDKLEDAIADLHNSAAVKNWEKNEWEDLKVELNIIREQIKELMDIKNTLKDDKSKKIVDITNKVSEKIHDWQKQEIAKLKRYFAHFLVTYVRDVSVMEKALKDLGEDFPQFPYWSIRWDIIYRTMGICFLFGILFGPAFHFFRGKPQLLEYSWCGVIALVSFGFIFSLNMSTKKKFTSISNTIYTGIIAGAVAIMIWYVSDHLFIKGQWELQAIWNVLKDNWQKMFIGSIYGSVIAMLLYVFRWKLPEKLKKPIFQYSGIGVVGSLAFVGIKVLVFPSPMKSMSEWGLDVVLGAIIMIAMAFALDIFNVQRVWGD